MSNLCGYESPFLVDEIELFNSLVHAKPPDKLRNVPHLLVGVLDVVPHVADVGWSVLTIWFPNPLIVRGPVELCAGSLHLRLLVPFSEP